MLRFNCVAIIFTGFKENLSSIILVLYGTVTDTRGHYSL